MIYIVMTYLEALALIVIGVVYMYKRLNKDSVIRLSGIQAKGMAKSGMEKLTGITYKGGALKRFYTEHVDSGLLPDKLPAYETAMKKLRDSYPVDQRFLKTVIKYCHGKKVEISD